MNITHILKKVAEDRALMASWAVLALLSLITTILLAIRVHPSDLNTQIHYSAFGITHIYNNSWYYLLPMVLFALTVLILHSALAAKLYIEKSKYIARLFIWVSIVVVVAAAFIGMGVLGLASI